MTTFADGAMMDPMESVQKILSHHFREVKLLTEALTHSSFANEQEASDRDNERLEFLGDAVLELTVSKALFERFPEAPEGELTRMRARLVSEPTLADLARDLGLREALRLGRGEEMQGGRDRDSLLSDTLEAILGAVFLDGGFKAARSLVERLYADLWPERPQAPKAKDHKSRLQELTQRLHKARPVYALVESFGPEHDKVFEVELSLPDGRAVRAQGPSMKKAEQTAAAKALELLSREGT